MTEWTDPDTCDTYLITDKPKSDYRLMTTGDVNLCDIATTYSFTPPPQPVGYWTLYPGCTHGRTQFAMYSKPTDEQIKNTEALLGWGWEDAK